MNLYFGCIGGRWGSAGFGAPLATDVRNVVMHYVPTSSMHSFAHHSVGTRYESIKSQNPIHSSAPEQMAMNASAAAAGLKYCLRLFRLCLRAVDRQETPSRV